MSTAGGRSHTFVHVRDLMPTILDVAGVDPPGPTFDGREVHGMQGQSLRGLVEGRVDRLDEDASRVGYELFGMKAYISYPWKILWLQEPYGPGSWELFDLESDPAELVDLSARRPEKLTEMVALWEIYKEENGVLDISLDVAGRLE